jgi:transcriptional regulator with XRE-family HTH domain
VLKFYKKGFEMKKEESLVKRTAKELGITQKELAEELGVAYRTVNAWNNGSTEIPEMAKRMFGLLKMKREHDSLKSKLIEVIKSDIGILNTLSK